MLDANLSNIVGGAPYDVIPGYHLVERIGRGGYGEVWKALAPGGVSKAIKLIYGDESSRMMTELRALNRVKDVRHPFLLSIERIEQRCDVLAIVTELADKNLQQHFQACRATGQSGIPQFDLLGMMRDVAEVLDYIYQEFSLQHLDIKPENLLLFGRRLKVGDFGLVKNIYERSASLVHGLTPTYAAPEIFDGQPTRTSDQYSLAILYQEMLTGILPFSGTTAARLATQHLREAPDLRSLPPSQQPVIARALSKDALQRYANCQELVEELTSCVKRAPTSQKVRDDVPLNRDSLSRDTTSVTAAAAGPISAVRSKTQSPTNEDTNHNPAPGSLGTVVPTIVIGIGGTAGKALQRLRLRINDRIGSVSSLPTFKMLFLDVDQNTLNDINRDQQVWSDLETVPTPLRSSAEYREQGHLHRRWLSRRWLFNVPRNLRTEGLRPLGRLALLSNANKVVASIRSAILQVTGTGSTHRNAAPPRILLVASISGGTGSGMLIDLAYTARHELLNAGFPDGTVDGLMLHSTPVGTSRDKAILNAIATLRELEHYSAAGNYYPGEPMLKTPPFHGNNQTFSSTQLMHLGEDQETSDWIRSIDHVAEHLYCRLLTPLDSVSNTPGLPTQSNSQTVDLVQIRQIGCYAGTFIEELTQQLCVDVLEGWCGTDLASQSGESRTSITATVILNAMEHTQSARHQAQIATAERQALACGIDIEHLLKQSREMLNQELKQSQRDYLKAQYEDAMTAIAEVVPLHEVATLVITMQDRAIGLDFGERPQNHAQSTLFDLLNSRLASQAMQIASRFTTWVSNLIDQPNGGVEAARVAAEAGRDCIRDMIGVLAKDIRERQGQQTNSRIQLTTPPDTERPSKASRGWLMYRGNPRTSLSEKLIEHGLLSFEELVEVLVQCQLRAIEANLSAMIDQLVSMWQELRLLGKRIGVECTSNNASSSYPSIYEQSLRSCLLQQRPSLVKELRDRIELEVLAGPKKLQRFLQQRGSFEQALGGPLRSHARQVVLENIKQTLCSVLQPHTIGHTRIEQNLKIDNPLGEILCESLPIHCGIDQQASMVVPCEVSLPLFEFDTATGTNLVPMVAARTNSVAVIRKSCHAPLASVVRAVAHGQDELITVAANLHTRIDVAWHHPEGAPASLGAEEADSPVLEWSNLTNTLSLD